MTNDFVSKNPATNEVVWKGVAANEKQIGEMIAKARAAFPAWRDTAIEDRIAVLEKFGKLLEGSRNEIALAIAQETGKPLWESLTEIAAMISKIAISIDAYRHRCNDIVNPLPHGTSITRHRPHGVIAVFGPFNFPGHLPNGHIIPALLAGNTVIFKPSELTPLVGEKLTLLWSKSGLPKSIFQLCQGGKETGQILANHPHIDGLFFTGSATTGQILAKNFANHPDKILALEMGGNNPLIVSRIQDMATAVYLTVQSSFLTSGQRCTCARRLIVPQGTLGDQFLEKLIATTEKLVVGPYNQIPEPYMGPVISAEVAEHLIERQQSLLSIGGKSLLTMHQIKANTGLVSPGIIDMTEASERPDVEIFGPLLQVIRTPDFKTAVNEANQTKYGLAAGLLSDDEEEYNYFYNHVKAGVVNWNAALTGASSAAPFGGLGYSGNFRPSAYYAADYCSYPVASTELNRMQKPQTLPPGFTEHGI